MPLDINFTLSEQDIEYFRDVMVEAQHLASEVDEATIIERARELLDSIDESKATSFVVRHLKKLRALVGMVGDEDWPLEEQERLDVISALAYFYKGEDVIDDEVPVLGLLDDAIVIELVVRELESEIEAYEEFCKIRAVYEQLEGRELSREDWLREKQHMLFEHMRDRMQRHRRTSKGVGRLTRFSLS